MERATPRYSLAALPRKSPLPRVGWLIARRITSPPGLPPSCALHHPAHPQNCARRVSSIYNDTTTITSQALNRSSNRSCNASFRRNPFQSKRALAAAFDDHNQCYARRSRKAGSAVKLSSRLLAAKHAPWVICESVKIFVTSNMFDLCVQNGSRCVGRGIT